MKFHFGTRAILLATAVVGIACGGMLGFARLLYADNELLGICIFFGMNMPFWLPVAFVAFAIGRKALTVPMILVFAILETAGVGASYWLGNHVVI